MGILSPIAKRSVVFAFFAGVIGLLPYTVLVGWWMGARYNELLVVVVLTALTLGGALGMKVWSPPDGW